MKLVITLHEITGKAQRINLKLEARDDVARDAFEKLGILDVGPTEVPLRGTILVHRVTIEAVNE